MIKTTKELNLPLSNCPECTLYNKETYNPHNYWGTLDKPDVLFIGEAPGKTEKSTGKAFQGRAGQLLQKKLREIGIRRFAIANVVACRPETKDKHDRIKDRKPTATEIKHCGENLEAIISQIKPRFIATLGATATQRMKIKGSITSNRGVMTETEYGPVLPIFHPAYILRSMNYIVEFEQDLKTLKRFIDGNAVIEEPQGDYIVIEDPTEVEVLEEVLASRKAFAFDIETDGLQFHQNKIMGIGFCNIKGKAYYVPLLTSVDKEPYWGEHNPKVIEILKRIMTSDVKKIAHNGKFDIKFIQYHWNITVTNFWVDTMLLHYVLDENKKHGLKELAGFYFPEMKNYDAFLRKALTIQSLNNESFGNVPVEVLGPYCAMDCESTYRLAKQLVPELSAGLKRLFFNFYMPLSKVYTESELVGVKIDVPYIKDLIEANKVRVEELKKDIYKIGEGEFNINSSQQLSAILFDKLKFPVIIKTASLAPSTSELALKEIGKKIKGHKIIDLILEFRKLTKMLTTYLGPMLDRVDEQSRIHPSFLLHGTVTGRISSKGPNIQNIPRDPTVKGMFVPEKGYTFVEIDFSQAELRVMAYYSKDNIMTKQYVNEEDIHLATASFIFMKESAEVSKRERKIAKLVNFGYLYGASAKKAHQSINERIGSDEKVISLREAQQFRDKFFQTYSGINRFISKSKILIHRKKSIKNCFGRIRRLPQVMSPYKEKQAEALRQGLNALIQGTASDLTQLALIRIHKFLLEHKSRFMFAVHDAIVFEVHEREQHLIPKLKQIMEDLPSPFNFPIVADVEIFENRWGNN